MSIEKAFKHTDMTDKKKKVSPERQLNAEPLCALDHGFLAAEAELVKQKFESMGKDVQKIIEETGHGFYDSVKKNEKRDRQDESQG